MNGVQLEDGIARFISNLKERKYQPMVRHAIFYKNREVEGYGKVEDLKLHV